MICYNYIVASKTTTLSISFLLDKTCAGLVFSHIQSTRQLFVWILRSWFYGASGWCVHTPDHSRKQECKKYYCTSSQPIITTGPLNLTSNTSTQVFCYLHYFSSFILCQKLKFRFQPRPGSTSTVPGCSRVLYYAFLTCPDTDSSDENSDEISSKLLVKDKVIVKNFKCNGKIGCL